MTRQHPVVARRFARPAIVLAPMEGVHDAAMRALMGELGGFTWGVAEFLRVSQVPLSAKQIALHLPELQNEGKTHSGLRIDPQLLGSDVDNLAQSAQLLAALGAEAIDLNFGCPAKTVNRHDGGASLLRTPHRIHDVVAGVRRAVPAHVAVSAKLRLGWERDDDILVNAQAAKAGGAQWLTVHGRTKADGYKPPARWQLFGRIEQETGLPLVANGDLFCVADVLRCRQETHCTSFMLGRGALADPLLACRVAHALSLPIKTSASSAQADWAAWLARYISVAMETSRRPERLVGRLKQWGVIASKHGGPSWIDVARRCRSSQEIVDAVRLFCPT